MNESCSETSKGLFKARRFCTTLPIAICLWLLNCGMVTAETYDNSYEGQRKRNTENQKHSNELSRLQRAAEDEFADKNYSEALRFADEGLTFRKTTPESINDVGGLAVIKAKSLEKLGKADEAVALLEAPREYYSSSKTVIETAVEMLISRKQYEQALQQCERLRNEYDSGVEKLVLRSRVLTAKGDRTGAIALLQDAYRERLAQKRHTEDIRAALYKLDADVPRENNDLK